MMIAGHSDPRMLLRIYNNLEVSHVANKLNNDSKSTKQNA
jgi:hypothetical protein